MSLDGGTYPIAHDDEHDFHPTADLTRPHSIDMSLELERQLENEPLSPHASTAPAARPVSMDPQVLSAIVTNMRMALVEVTSEKDDMVEALGEAHAREAELKEALSIMSERCANLEIEMQELKKKSQGDDEAIAMLRSKVEESRRGLMRLQTESRRMSQISNLSLDLSKSPSAFMAPPGSSKGATFAPLAGSPRANLRGHRRISSVSGYGSQNYDEQMGEFPSSPSQSAFVTDELRPPADKRRISGIFGGRISPPERLLDIPGASSAQLEALRRELETTKAELEQAKNEIAEAYEAKEASEQCVNALRTFIVDNGVGESNTREAEMRPKSVPVDARTQTEQKKAAGWSALKLWRADTNAGTQASSPVVPSNTAESPALGSASTTSPAVPLSKVIGGFFSGRSSISSETPRKQDGRPYNHQEPMLNGSDTDSDHEPEPLSPATYPTSTHGSVLVRDISSISSNSGVTSSLEPSPMKSVLSSEVIPKPLPTETTE